MLRHALVPLDNAPETEHAVKTAVQLARGYGAQVTGLYVRETCSIGEKIVQVPQTPAEKAMGERQSQAIRTFRSVVESAGVDFHCDIECGDAPEEIARMSAMADLIIMAPTEGNFDVLENLVKTVPHPFIAVRQAVDNIGRLGVAYDGSRGASRALGLAADIIAHWKQGALELVLIESDRGEDTRAIDVAKRYLEAYRIEPQVVVSKGAPVDAIVEACSVENVDLLCMGAFGSWSMRTMLMGSVTQQVLKRRKKPILMCH